MNMWIINNNTLFYKGDSYSRELVNIKDNNVIEIKIKSCKFDELSSDLDKYEIPSRTYLYEDSNTNKMLQNQTIYIITKDNLKYYITIGEDEIRISEYATLEYDIYETVINFNRSKYKISKYVHSLNHSTKEMKWYPSNNTLSMFKLEKAEALMLAKKLVDNLKQIKNIENIIHPSIILDVLNIIDDGHYKKVIEDDIIALYTNSNKNFDFTIVLKETSEILGDISYERNPNFSYGGNVSCGIIDDYQNNGYATMALALLKEYLTKNMDQDNIDLYLSTSLNNISSQKVIEKNNGKLIYEGEVPKEDTVFKYGHIKSVKVYKISIKK